MKFLREPLVHFLLAGAAIFTAYAVIDRAPTQQTGDQREVRIGAGDVRWATETWTRQWQRSPSPDELRGLIRDLLKEELLAREARELGLDKDDAVVRRRLAQKMNFVIEDTSQAAKPSQQELRQFYETHLQEFRREARVSFTQLFFDRARAGAEADAKEALVELTSVNDSKLSADKGDQLLIEPQVSDADERSVVAQFGQDFARAVFALTPGVWQGPIKSAYGLHLVRVSAIRPAEQRSFAEVRDQVVELWREAQEIDAHKRYFEELSKKYRIVIDDNVDALIGAPAADLE